MEEKQFFSLPGCDDKSTMSGYSFFSASKSLLTASSHSAGPCPELNCTIISLVTSCFVVIYWFDYFVNSDSVFYSIGYIFYAPVGKWSFVKCVLTYAG